MGWSQEPHPHCWEMNSNSTLYPGGNVHTSDFMRERIDVYLMGLPIIINTVENYFFIVFFFMTVKT